MTQLSQVPTVAAQPLRVVSPPPLIVPVSSSKGAMGGLVRRVRHVSVEDGDGAGYDIESFDPDGVVKQIEVKTTRGTATTPFFISRNEKAVSERRRETYRIHRVHEYGVRPSVFELRPPLEDAVARLVPEVWRAEMR